MEQLLILKSLEARLSRIEHRLQDLVSRNNNEHSKSSSEFLTIQQASELTKKAIQTIYGNVSRREIPHLKVGKHLYFKKEDLCKWIEAGRRKTKNEISNENVERMSKSNINLKKL